MPQRAALTIEPCSDPPAELEPYGRPQYRLHAVTRLAAVRAKVFDFFADAKNLERITPAWLGFDFVGTPPKAIDEGTLIDYRIRFGPVPIRWRTEIVVWQPPNRFVDYQDRGPYALWWHEHHFAATESDTEMRDTVYYALPLGGLGRLGQPMVARALRQIFGFRARAIRELLPA